MTYTAVATVWGVIGSASPNGWNDETALTYKPALSTWTGGIHLTAAEIKLELITIGVTTMEVIWLTVF